MMTDRETILNAAYVDAETRHRVGPMLKYCRESGAESPAEFRQWYTEHVHGEDYLEEIAEDMSEQTAIAIPVCREYLNQKLFIRSFRGLHAQIWMRDLLRAFGISAKIASDEWDAKYGVDIIAGANGELFCGIQCKSETQRGMTDDRLTQQMRLWREDTKTPIFIIHYKEDWNGRRSIASESEMDVIRLIQTIYTERRRAMEETANRLAVVLDETV